MAGRFMPGYAVMIALACVGGACSEEVAEPSCPPCKPQMSVEINGSALGGSVCNNDTFSWMVHIMLAEIARQREEMDEEKTVLWDYVDRLRDTENMAGHLYSNVQDIQDENVEIKKENQRLREDIKALKQGKHSQIEAKPRDCADIQHSGSRYSGLYMIYPYGFESGLQVYCDLNTNNGGWLVLQRRENGAQDFAQDWETYKNGFGLLNNEFYLGNEKIHKLTQQRRYRLRVEITDYSGEDGYAEYGRFGVESEEEKYRLKVSDYSGNAGDSLMLHNRQSFSTYDVDNDESQSGHCSRLFGNGGGWFVRCYDANLNGQYGTGIDSKGVVWFRWKNDFTPLLSAEMKIRPLDFEH